MNTSRRSSARPAFSGFQAPTRPLPGSSSKTRSTLTQTTSPKGQERQERAFFLGGGQPEHWLLAKCGFPYPGSELTPNPPIATSRRFRSTLHLRLPDGQPFLFGFRCWWALVNLARRGGFILTHHHHHHGDSESDDERDEADCCCRHRRRTPAP